MEYLLKTSAVVAIFYLSYKLFLERDTFFESNRWFLLLGLLTSFIIPFLVIPVYVEVTPLDLTAYEFTYDTSIVQAEKPFSFLDYLPAIYFLGVTFFTLRFAIQFLSLTLTIINNKGEKNGRNIFIKTTNKVSPFSFFNWIVYNPNQFNEQELEQIITHEQVHAHQSHSLDILLTHLSCIVLWFNPFIWLYKKDLKQNLEFIADRVTASKTECKKSYQYTLLKTSMPTHQMALSNNFYNSLIKKRIVMLHKSKSKKINQLKYALVLPMHALFLMSFNTKDIYITQQNTSKKTLVKTNVIEIFISKDFTDVDLENLQKELKQDGYATKFKGVKRNSENEITAIKIQISSKSSNAKYSIDENEPINPIKISINDNDISIGNGTILKEKHMVLISDDEDEADVTPSGSEKNVIIISSDDNDNTNIKEEIIIKNEDSIQYYKKPGSDLKPWKITIGRNAVSDTVNWASSKKRVGLNWVSEEEQKVNIHSKSESKVKIVTSSDKEPLFIVDGKEITKDDMNNIDPNTIEKVEVIKDEIATKKYGEKAKNGIVEITAKKDKRETHIIIDKSMKDVKVIGYGKASDTIKAIRIGHKINPISKDENPLFFVDGKIKSKEAAEKISPDSIKTINVLKGDAATKKYGEKATNGVIEITTKK